MKAQLKGFYLATLLCPHWCLGENMTSYIKMATVQEEAMCLRSPLSKRNVVTELNMEKIHLQIMLSYIG
jgi:hypothetical protein